MDAIIYRSLKILAGLAITVLLGVGSVVLYLAYPGTPSHSRVMAFDGYVELPKHGALNVLDYLNVQGNSLFVTDESSGSLFKIALSAREPEHNFVSEMVGRGSTHGVAMTSDPNLAYLTRSGENTVDAFNPTTLERIESIPVAEDADAILYDKDVDLIYVANGDPKLATLIDAKNRTTVGTIALPGKPEFAAVDKSSGLVYQNLEDIAAVAAVDLGKRSVVGQWSLTPCEAPTGMAIDADSRRLFAVCAGNASLVVFDLNAHRVLTSLKIGGGPDSVAIDPTLHRIYSAGKSGKLTVIQEDSPDSYKVLDEIDTHYGAHTLVVDLSSHEVFVGYASLFAHPRIAAFSPIP